MRRVGWLVAFCGCGLGVQGTFVAGDGGPPPDAASGSDALAPPPPPGDDAGVDAPACTADLANDPKNCGACGRDCGGSACTAGACAPVAIVTTSPNDVRSVAVSDTRLFWSSQSAATIRAAALDGTGSVVVVSRAAEEIAVDATWLYYVSGGNLRRAKHDGSADTQLASGWGGCVFVGPSPLVYGLDASSKLFELDTTTLAQRTVATSADGVFQPWGVAVSGADLYWSGIQHNFPDGGIWRRPLDGGVTAEILLHQGNPNCLTMHDSMLWWPNADEGAILRSDLAGAGRVVLATGQTIPTTVAVDAKFVYWNSGNSVMRLAR